MGFSIKGGDKSSLALLSNKKGRAYARTKADEAFALPNFSDAMPVATTEPHRHSNSTQRPEQPVEHDAYARTRADEAFALPNSSDAMPLSSMEPHHHKTNTQRPELPAEPYAKALTRTDEAFALPKFSDSMPISTTQLHQQSTYPQIPGQRVEHYAYARTRDGEAFTFPNFSVATTEQHHHTTNTRRLEQPAEHGASARTRADEAFALLNFPDAIPFSRTEPHRHSTIMQRPQQFAEHYAYARTGEGEGFAFPNFSDAMPVTTTELHRHATDTRRPWKPAEHIAYASTRADGAFALPNFPDTLPFLTTEPHRHLTITERPQQPSAHAAYARTREDEAFELPNFSDSMPVSMVEPHRQSNIIWRPGQHADYDAYARTREDQAFPLQKHYAAMPISMMEPHRQSNIARRLEPPVEHEVKQTMLQHESVFKEQLHELHRLYQKQCMLMVESNKDPVCGGAPEPPSPNSSFLCNPEASSLQEERSFGNAYFTKVCESNQSYSALFGRVDGVKQLEDRGSSRKSSSHQSSEVCGSSRKQSRHQMLNLEKPALYHPIIDLERPADEYMDVEVQEEKAQTAGLINKSNDAFVSGYSNFSGSNKTRMREVASGISRGSWDKKLHPFPLDPVTTPSCLKEESHLYPKASRLSKCLPDLNGDINSTEQQLLPMQPLLQKNLKDGQCVDIEVDSRSCSSTSKLPHWLWQVPPARPFPLHVSDQSSGSQPKASAFIPQVHNMPMRTSHFLLQGNDQANWCNNLPAEMTKASSFDMQEPNCPSRSSTIGFEQGDAFLREPHSVSSLQFYGGANTGATEGSYSGPHGRDYARGGIPFHLSQARESESMGIRPPTSVHLFSHVMENQGLEFGTHDPSAEPLSRVSLERPVTFSTTSPWCQQRESFSSLLHQASNPEPVCKGSSLATSVSPLEFTSDYGSSFGMDRLDRGVHTDVRNTEGSSSQLKRNTASPPLDHMHAGSALDWTIDSRKECKETSCKQAEMPLLCGKAQEVSSSGNHHRDPYPRKILFDLNVSNEDCMTEGNIDPCYIIDSTRNADRRQSPKPESEASKSGGILNAFKAPFMCKPQTDCTLQAACFGDSVAAKGTTSDVPFDNCLHNQTSFLSVSADNLYLEGDMIRNETRADYCSGEDEAGGGFLGVKSSDGSALTSCESRDRVHLELVRARDDSNTSSSEACHSFESRIPNNDEDMFFSSNLQGKRSYNGATKEELDEASEAAEFLLSLGLDLPSRIGNDDASDECRKWLDCLCDILPPEDIHEESCRPKDMDVEMTFVVKHEARRDTEHALEATPEDNLDSFELAVLSLKPVDPTSECLAIWPLGRGNVVENTPTLRRRPSRRGRAGKDSQKEMFRSMSALSRFEITEDLQIIEGLIKSAAETTNSCSSSPDNKPLSSPEGSFKSFGKVKTNRGGKLDGMLSVCSWGESTRRKRMRRQRSQWLSLPPGVRASLFRDSAASVVL